MALESLKQIVNIGKEEVPQVEEPETIVPKTKWFIFYIDDEKYSVKESQVVSILRDVKLYKYPFAPDFIEGVINFHNKIYSAINYKKLIKTQTNDSDLSLFIVVKTESDDLAIRVSKVEDFFMIPDEAYSENNLKDEKSEENPFIQGYFLFNDEKIPVLDISSINQSIIFSCKKVGV